MIVKRNNPGNIRKTATKWQGELPGIQLGEIISFDTLVNGYRAQLKLLNNYIVKGYDTLSRIISRWAPPSDNNPTTDYIKYVSLKTGLQPDKKIAANDYSTLTKVALAMSFFEHGILDDDGTLSEAIDRAKSLLYRITAEAKDNPLTTAAILATLYFLIRK